jgi:hypothetical protein
MLQELRPAKEARFKQRSGRFRLGVGDPRRRRSTSPIRRRRRSRRARAGRAGFARTGGLIEPPYLSKDQLQVYRDRAPGAGRPARGRGRAQADLGDGRGAVDRPPDRRRGEGRHADHARAQPAHGAGLPPRRRGAVQEGGQVQRRSGARRCGRLCQRRPAGRSAGAVRRRAQHRRRLDERAGQDRADRRFRRRVRQAVHRAAGCSARPAKAARPAASPTGTAATPGCRRTWPRSDFQARISRASPRDWVAPRSTRPAIRQARSPHHLGADGKPKPTSSARRSRASAAARCRRSRRASSGWSIPAAAMRWSTARGGRGSSTSAGCRLRRQLAAHGYVRR